MRSRRWFLIAGSAIAASIARVGSAADLLSVGGRPRVRFYTGTPVENYRDYDGPLQLLQPRGIEDPLLEEIETAKIILGNAPKSTPFDVVRYFERLSLLNRDQEAYNAWWKDLWNPVIVAFFQETQTTPAGDTTAWCAAFINWCLARAGYLGGTGSAASASFRDAPGKTNNPSAGDIIVFKDTAQPTKGHVGLVLAKSSSGKQFQVLGGNQQNALGHHSVNTMWLPKPGSSLAFHSFHKISAFKTA